MKTQFGPFSHGITNREPEYALPKKEGGDYLRDAMNVDITPRGTIKRRTGYVRVGDYTPEAAPVVSNGAPREYLGHVIGDLNGSQQGVHINRRVAVVGNKLLYSVPFATSLTNQAFHYEEFNAPITGWISTDSGLYVSAECMFYIPGALPAKEVRQVFPVPALPGSFGTFPHTQDIFFVTSQGVMIGTQDGEVRATHWDDYSVDFSGRVAATYRERDGLRQILVVVDQFPAAFPSASESCMDAQVF